MRRPWPSALVLSILAGSLLALGTTAAANGTTVAPASNSATFRVPKAQDPQAPNITTIVVSNNDPGMITFRINVPNRPQLGADMLFDVFVDADRRATTGSASLAGVDYVIELAGGDINLFKWDGTNFTRRGGDPSAATLSYSYHRGVTIRISAADLGNTRGFRFFVAATSGVAVDPDTGDLDFSNSHDNTAHPSAGGLYSFAVKMRPVRLVVRQVTSAPAAPGAGKPFSVRLTAARSDTGARLRSGQVTCVGRLGGTTLPSGTPHFAGTAAVCTWKIPQSAKGKRFVGKVAVEFEGQRIAGDVSARVG